MPTAIAIRTNHDGTDAPTFQASSGNRFAVGRTMGEALDALISDWEGEAEPSAILIERFRPDSFFTQAQHDRMRYLLSRRSQLSDEEQAELESLIDAELDATVARTDHLVPHGQL